MSTYGGHCRHCDNLCQKWSDDLAEYEVEFAHYDGTGYWWHDGDCPACAEAKRIVAKIHAALDETPLLLDDTLDYRQGLLDAVEMARGES